MKVRCNRSRTLGALALAAWFGLLGCQARTPSASSEPGDAPTPRGQGGRSPAKITLISTAFTEGNPIPKRYSGEGEDVSPPLAWSGAPTGAKEFALICDDPDAPAGTWTHWVICKIPAGTASLPEAVEKTPRPAQPAGAVQGLNSWNKSGYGGPMPPRGRHRYYFKLYALDSELPAAPDLTKQALLEKIAGHVLGEGQLMGTYQR